MAQVVSGNQVKLNNGSTITATQGGWYDGQQFWGGTLSQPGQINSQSNQQGAGQLVSNEVIAQTNPNNVAYVAQQRQQAGLTPSPATGTPSGGQAVSQPVSQPSTAGTTSITGFNQPTIDLPALYQGLYDKSGVKALTEEITTSEKQYLEARNKISDNPFLDASSIDKRLQRLANTYEAEVKPKQDKIALLNTDIQNQLKLQTDQFNINSQQAQLALTQFQTLLQSGAFDSADVNSIISVANATGLSTSMIQSAIDANKAKNVETTIQSWDDGTNEGYVVINSKTGEIINKQTVGASKPTGSSASETKAAETRENQANLITDIKNKKTLKELVNYYAQVLDIETIYRLYNSYSPYGVAKETPEQVMAGQFVS
jgi:hypothetical protein